MLSLEPSPTAESSLRSPAARPDRAPPACTFCFSIHAAAEPGVMPRVLELFAKRNLVPRRWVSGVHGTAEGRGELVIDLQVAGLTRQDSAYLVRCLEQITDVRSVLTSEKGRA